MSSRSSSPERSLPLPDTVEVARVRRPHGVRGDLLVEVSSDVESRFAEGSRLLLRAGDGRSRAVTVTSSRPHGGGRILHLSGLDDRDLAAEWRGAVLEAERSTVPPAPEGTYYYFELVGCRCADRTVGDLGVVVDLVEDGGGLLLEVEGAAGRVLVPFVESFVAGVDVAGRRMELDLPPGLIETCASKSSPSSPSSSSPS